MPKGTTSDGVELYYETLGSPDAPQKVVFVMGLSGSHKGWNLQSKYFAAQPDYQVLVLDNRGAGFSQTPVGPYTMARMAEDVITLADQAGFHKFHLVGISMGGMISQHIALARPERIISLTLMVTRVEGGFFKALPTFQGVITFLKMTTTRDRAAMLESGLNLLFPAAYLSAPLDNYGKTNRDKLREDFLERSVGVPEQPEAGRKGQMAALQAHGLTPTQMNQLKKATFPILAIVGDQDILIKPQHSYGMPEFIGADLLILEGAGHGVTHQCPTLINKTLHHFFGESASGTPRNSPPKIKRVPAVSQSQGDPEQEEAEGEGLAESVAALEENSNL